jgi:hypothetical protein
MEASPGSGLDEDRGEGGGSAMTGEPDAGGGAETLGGAGGVVTAPANAAAARVGPGVACTACETDASGPLNARLSINRKPVALAPHDRPKDLNIFAALRFVPIFFVARKTRALDGLLSCAELTCREQSPEAGQISP